MGLVVRVEYGRRGQEHGDGAEVDVVWVVFGDGSEQYVFQHGLKTSIHKHYEHDAPKS